MSCKDFGETVNLDEAFSKVTKMLDKIEIQRTQEQEKGFQIRTTFFIQRKQFLDFIYFNFLLILKIVRFV